jgi:L-ascorbate metabolism protein UlaG (beta-lactamase superfamily)
MIRPYLQDDGFLADVARATADQPDSLHLWWLGQSGYLVQHGNTRFLFDPYLSDSLTSKYAQTDKPHVRLTERVVAPERLTGISFATSTHNHTDHLDTETLLPIFASNPGAKLVLPRINEAFAAERLGISPFIGSAEGETVTLDGVEITGVGAAHEEYAPTYLGFVVRIGGWTLYHSGDTVLFDGMVEQLRPHQIDIALLPINGRAPERRVAGNLWGHEAAWLAKEIGAKVVIPCHYEMFAFNTATPDAFVAECQQLGQAHHILRAGERVTFPLPHVSDVV